MKSQLTFHSQLPPFSKYPKDTILLYDQALCQYSPAFKKWSSRFPVRLGLAAGEANKSLENFPALVAEILKRSEKISSREMTLLVVGGGTLTDLGGFLASVMKRGICLILMPTTWLAAIDSAHGGKNGLNIFGYKNQIGTFYFPERIEIVKSILLLQSSVRAREAFGELFKIALISRGPLLNQVKKFKTIDAQKIYSALPQAIQAKNCVVDSDPFEKKNKRHVLNLGHTFAHAIEKVFKIPHGEAVLYGLVFSLIWSRSKKLISTKDFDQLIQLQIWSECFSSEIYFHLLSAPLAKIKNSIAQDKKKNSRGELLEPFIKAPGQVILRKVTVEDFVQEFQRQKKFMQRAKDASLN